ncbi:D-tyrosyl-tRNA(Tyr) deacylase [Phragmitibacter flavus]|uniref:D-aminoacyl-tRNA deacylase n=1 Tax=Phragmitibacter flavus TaxID=2576071 RepID=A0A5R8KCR4_9BACT|nr:D-aminoacyl-tRNA deacylase [Phragmitibacter flavus]TLD69725.1 D-tyrosyl-tRNA(Tyr) deacylase [Phragmitibacter flavus]
MRLLVQRVSQASVHIHGQLHDHIQRGLLIFVGIEAVDTLEDATWLASKIAKIRLFPDDQAPINADLAAVNGQLLVISQFTLHASTRKGNRPSFIRAARPEHAEPLYQNFLQLLENLTNTEVKRGVFGADMQISLINDGPVTIWIDSQNRE